MCSVVCVYVENILKHIIPNAHHLILSAFQINIPVRNKLNTAHSSETYCCLANIYMYPTHIPTVWK